MRNSKKLFAVMIVVAMLASIMVPAFAATYQSDAQKLYNLGLFKGYSESDFGLSDNITREQGLTFMIRASGLEDEALDMSAEEIAAQLAKVTDLETVTEWAKPYVAYAVKNGLTKGTDSSILPNIKFEGQLLLTGKEFINFMLNAMGYAEPWDSVLTKAAEIGMLTVGQSVTFGLITELDRDLAVGIIAFAMGGTTASGVTLAQALVDSGDVDAEAMADAGYYVAAPAPTAVPKALTATASTNNLIEINVEYSQKVDATTAKNKDNYTLSSGKVASATLKDDGVTVVLRLEGAKLQQDKVDLTIKNVKDAADTVIKETKLEGIEFFDVTPPEVVDVTVVGKDTFKVTFSETMKDSNKANFEVNGGKLYVKSITHQSNNKEMLVTMYSTFAEGEITLKVKSGNVDLANFSVKEEVFTLNVVKDAEAPVVIGYESASPTKVVLLWSEDISAIAAFGSGNYYHTNANSKPSAVAVDGSKMTLTFANADALPQGTAYVYVLKDSVKDLWDNKNVQQMTKVEVTIDEIAPEVKSVKQGASEKEVVVTFSEEMDLTSVQKAANYIVLDSEGKEQKDLVKTVVLSVDKKVATIELTKKIGGDFALVVANVKDLAGNSIVSVTVPFAIIDKTVPVKTDFEATLYNAGAANQMIKINFKEGMAIEGKYAINDIEKYQYVEGGIDKPFKALKNVTIKVVDNGKAVEIAVPHEVDGVANKTFADGDLLLIARVADAAGNYTVDLFFDLNLVEANVIAISSVEATALNVVKINFADEVNFEIADFTVNDGTYDLVYAEVETTLVSGKTVATLKLTENIPCTWSAGDYVLNVVAAPATKNAYGVSVSSASVNVADKIKPILVKVADKLATFTNGAVDSTITLKFSENLVADTTLYAHDLVIKNASGTVIAPISKYTALATGNDSITITVLGVTDLTGYSIESAGAIRYIIGADGNMIAVFPAIVN